MPSRRAFIHGGVAILASRGGAALAQEKIYRVGIIDALPAASNAENLAQFLRIQR